MIDFVNGKTRVFGLIGDPVEHSLSPLIHNTLSNIMGINNVYVAFPVKDSLKGAIEGAYALSVRGLNITVPYKKDVMPLLCRIDRFAEQIGAVNALMYTETGYMGYNTDVYGIMATLSRNNIYFDDQAALIIGAGGGAYSAAFGAAAHGARELYIVNRSNKNASLLASRIKKYYNVIVNIISYDDIQKIESKYYVIQATSVGMSSGNSPIKSIDSIKKATGVFDIIYTPLETKLMSDAKVMGIPVVNGLYMLATQAVKAFEIWNGATVPEEYIDKLTDIAQQML